MKKLTIVQRLFWSSEKINEYIMSDNKTESLAEVKALYEGSIKDRDAAIAEYRMRIQTLQTKLTELETSANHNSMSMEQKDASIAKLREDLAEVKAKVEAKASENANLKAEISEKLIPLAKIDKTFFASTGNKGKGELGERQLKVILEKSGLDDNFWVENLQVNSAVVEFAIKSGDEGKWIPVDSKVLDPEFDEDGIAVVDAKYKSRVNTQAKEVAKYLGKAKTANYGILVLQSDSIYMKLFEEFPTFFQETIRDHKIHVMSPSSFVQFAWSIAQILDVYEKVHNDELIYDEMISALNTTAKFASSLEKVHKDFNNAMNAHYPALSKKHSKLAKKLDKQGKLKEVKSIEFKGEQ